MARQLVARAESAATDNVARQGFEQNTTTFGGILRGDLPAKIVYEDDQVLAFCDIDPASEHHYLVIPKRHINSCLFNDGT